MRGWNLVLRIVCIVLAGLAVVGLFCLFIPRASQIRNLQARQKALEEENRDTEQKIKEFKAQQQQFSSDPAFVERTARETGLIKPDENVFRMTNAVMPR